MVESTVAFLRLHLLSGSNAIEPTELQTTWEGKRGCLGYIFMVLSFLLDLCPSMLA